MAEQAAQAEIAPAMEHFDVLIVGAGGLAAPPVLAQSVVLRPCSPGGRPVGEEQDAQLLRVELLRVDPEGLLVKGQVVSSPISAVFTHGARDHSTLVG